MLAHHDSLCVLGITVDLICVNDFSDVMQVAHSGNSSFKVIGADGCGGTLTIDHYLGRPDQMPRTGGYSSFVLEDRVNRILSVGRAIDNLLEKNLPPTPEVFNYSLNEN